MNRAAAPITTAMVLAAGLGVRMRHLTADRPKPLIDVAGKALIDYTLDRFAAAGVSRAIVNVHYFADQIERRLEGRRTPAIVISDERGERLETGGGLRKARAHFEGEAIFCANTDAILLDGPGGEPCARLAAAWAEADADMLLLLAPIGETTGYDGAGDFSIDAERRLAFRTGPSAPYVFTGLQILRPALLDDTPEGAFSTKWLWERAAACGRLKGLVHDGFWMHVGDPEGLALAERRLGDRA